MSISAYSFVSSYSNRDLNLQMIIEVAQYPLITVKGHLSESSLAQDQFDVPAMISFHGVEKSYILKVTKAAPFFGEFSLLLEDHKIDRPSFLMARIENEVPLRFTFTWKESP